ncbi:cyclic nucleotide-binding domain-containing protein 1 isoform X3 [Rhinoraja longicauda]
METAGGRRREMAAGAPAAICGSNTAPTAGTNYSLGIDYENVQKLCNISGLQSRDNPQSTPEAHCEFLQRYRKIFIQPKPVLPKIPVLASKLTKKPKRKGSEKDDESYLDKRYMDDIPHHLKEDVKTLFEILSKNPYYRTRSERLIAYKILRLLPAINKQFADEELENLSGKIILESWEKSCVVFGYQSFYMILRGCAKPYSLLGEASRPNRPPPWLDPTMRMLSFGDSFGSLLSMSKDAGLKVLSVLTESNCQLVKISAGQFENTKKQSEVKHILMEKLIENQSFGEISIILREPFTCTIITATEVELGVISESDLLGLEEVYRMLIQQTAEPILGNLTQEEVNNRYIFLEKEKQWKRFKDKVIKETILYRGIKPGIGKWKCNCTKKKL